MVGRRTSGQASIDEIGWGCRRERGACDGDEES